MSISVIDEINSSKSIEIPAYLAERRAVVAEIISKHSMRLFGHENASIRQVRYEAIRRNLESAFVKS